MTPLITETEINTQVNVRLRRSLEESIFGVKFEKARQFS